jgi:hypothetical protein
MFSLPGAASSMSERGSVATGSSSSGFGHVRFYAESEAGYACNAPIATKFRMAAKRRDAPSPDIKLKRCIARGLRNALIDAGARGPIQEVERQKLEHGNNKRSDGFPKIMLVQADTSVQHLYDSRHRAQDL